MIERAQKFTTNLIPREWHKIVKKAGYQMIAWAFRGDLYICPFCNHHLRRYLGVGHSSPALQKYEIVGSQRRNGLCPFCLSKDRERLVFLYLLNETNISQEKLKVLHLAPEFALEKWMRKQRNLEYYTGDLIYRNVDFKIDVCNISQHNCSFDVIICNHVLEHVVDDQKAMREFHRILKPGGWAILQVPISGKLLHTFEDISIKSPHQREATFGQHDHVRIYAMDYISRLEEAGFKVSIFNWEEHGSIYGLPINHYGLLRGELVFRVSKPFMNES